MSGPTFQPGERVRVTVEGVVMEPVPGDAAFAPNGFRVRYAEPLAGIFAEVHVTQPDALAVSVERITPPEWPPRPGDLWRDRHGDLWFFRQVHGQAAPVGYTAGPRWTDSVPDLLTSGNDPWTLVHRDDPATSGAVSTSDMPQISHFRPDPDATQVFDRVERC